jgi:hypothetical protein
MKLHLILSAAVIILNASIAKAETEVFEYTDPDSALYWIALNINESKVSGDITKYLSEDMKEKIYEEKFEGKVISGQGTENLKLEIMFQSKKSDMNEVANVRINKNGKSIWKLNQSSKLVVPMFFYISQGVEEDAEFHFLTPNLDSEQ